jgi:hypothetical protein
MLLFRNSLLSIILSDNRSLKNMYEIFDISKIFTNEANSVNISMEIDQKRNIVLYTNYFIRTNYT